MTNDSKCPGCSITRFEELAANARVLHALPKQHARIWNRTPASARWVLSQGLSLYFVDVDAACRSVVWPRRAASICGAYGGAHEIKSSAARMIAC